MVFIGDPELENKILNLKEEIQSKRDSSKSYSKEKKYYKVLSKSLDQLFHKLDDFKTDSDESKNEKK